MKRARQMLGTHAPLRGFALLETDYYMLTPEGVTLHSTGYTTYLGNNK